MGRVGILLGASWVPTSNLETEMALGTPGYSSLRHPKTPPKGASWDIWGSSWEPLGDLSGVSWGALGILFRRLEFLGDDFDFLVR